MADDLKELHEVELEMLLQLRRICEKYKLTYYLSGGTFLGAVRHQGFIPWDDDMDIALPREDYRKFVKVVNKELPEGMEFKCYATDPDYHHPVARLVNHKVCVINHSFSDDRIEPAWIDIFPLDGMPDGKIALKLQKIRLLWRRVTIGWANYKDVQDTKPNRPWYEKFLMFIGTTLKPGRFMNLTKQYAKLEKTLMRYPASKSRVYMNFNGAYRFNSIMDKKKYYGKGALYTFEGEQFPAPANYDAYLTKIYGDYMKLPPEEKRNTHSTELVRK
ncbi:MAG: LicD family protein [Lachnospiraceae bacterium]|nr:LicD family protein [Lachnospiraceae bacterium]